jgi:hypothetical protein
MTPQFLTDIAGVIKGTEVGMFWFWKGSAANNSKYQKHNDCRLV